MMDINVLRPLPDFSWQHAAVRDVDQNYFDFYGIGFAQISDQAVSHHFGILPLAGFSIAVHYFTLSSNTKTVVLNHGYYDHVGLYSHLIRMLLESGYDVLAYDLPGHGLSSGDVASIASFADYQQVLVALLDAARPHVRPFYGCVGQSTGGSIVMDYVLNNPQHDFHKIILLAPLVVPKYWICLQGLLFTAGFFIDGLPRLFGRNSHDKQFLRFVKKQDPLQSPQGKTRWIRALLAWQGHFLGSPVSSLPTLLLQGDKDSTVAWRYNLSVISKKFTNVQIVMLRGAMHHLANESDDYRQQIYTQIKKFL